MFCNTSGKVANCNQNGRSGVLPISHSAAINPDQSLTTPSGLCGFQEVPAFFLSSPPG